DEQGRERWGSSKYAQRLDSSVAPLPSDFPATLETIVLEKFPSSNFSGALWTQQLRNATLGDMPADNDVNPTSCSTAASEAE
ncbi:MAG: hypothetical protein ACKPKO_21875, partial [Candidatus Fonsibacter sp.]